jgi:hypothetical protein
MSIRAFLPFFPPFFLGFRLGVGAPLPETPAPAQTRLVQKLEGGKRRAQELENGVRGVAADNDEQGEEMDSAEESRAAGIAIRKRQWVDPFEPGRKKRKKKVAGLGLEGGTVETTQAKDDIEMEEAPSQSESMAMDDAMTRPGPKKKKKKKHHLPESQGAQGHARGGPGGESRSARLDADITQHSEPSTQSSILEEWDGIRPDQQGSRCGIPGSSSSGMFFI